MYLTSWIRVILASQESITDRDGVLANIVPYFTIQTARGHSTPPPVSTRDFGDVSSCEAWMLQGRGESTAIWGGIGPRGECSEVGIPTRTNGVRNKRVRNKRGSEQAGLGGRQWQRGRAAGAIDHASKP